MLLTCLLLAGNAFVIEGCGAGNTVAARQLQGSGLGLPISTAVVAEYSSLSLVASGSRATGACTWSSSDSYILVSTAGGEFMGGTPGSTIAAISCEGATVSTPVRVRTKASSGPIKITSGGIYSGNWTSNNPTIPAVTILTEEPVTIQNSTLTGNGVLIQANGVKKGGQITIDNVTGTALDPMVAGVTRGGFVNAGNMRSVSITHCTMHGVAFGVIVYASTLSSLTITGNMADGLEDRTSDGKGGLTSNRPLLGHFIHLHGVYATNGADIGWNQMINVVGASSVEDVINLYESHGTAHTPIVIHDNYLEGGSSSTTEHYVGFGFMMDGPATNLSTATGFVQITNNQVVHTTGSGIGIAAGHDISASGNRIVSCGQNVNGSWIAMPWASAISMFNFYHTGIFYNNVITKSTGGLIRPAANGSFAVQDVDSSVTVLASLNNSMSGNTFDDPCIVNHAISLQSEATERSNWTKKVGAAAVRVGAK